MPIAGATNSSLTFPNIQPTAAGSYQIVVTNNLGIAASVPAIVNVSTCAPFFLTTAASRFAYVGTKVSLGALVDGSGPLQLQWLFDGQPVVGGTNDELILNAAQTTNSGAYSLIASNAFASITSSIANLTVV